MTDGMSVSHHTKKITMYILRCLHSSGRLNGAAPFNKDLVREFFLGRDILKEVVSREEFSFQFWLQNVVACCCSHPIFVIPYNINMVFTIYPHHITANTT